MLAVTLKIIYEEPTIFSLTHCRYSRTHSLFCPWGVVAIKYWDHGNLRSGYLGVATVAIDPFTTVYKSWDDRF